MPRPPMPLLLISADAPVAGPLPDPTALGDALWPVAGGGAATLVVFLIWKGLRWTYLTMAQQAADGEKVWENRIARGEEVSKDRMTQLAADFDAYRVFTQAQIAQLVHRLDVAEEQLALCRAESAETHEELAQTRGILAGVRWELSALKRQGDERGAEGGELT